MFSQVSVCSQAEGGTHWPLVPGPAGRGVRQPGFPLRQRQDRRYPLDRTGGTSINLIPLPTPPLPPPTHPFPHPFPLARTGSTCPLDRRMSDATSWAVRLSRSRRRTLLSFILYNVVKCSYSLEECWRH